MIRTLCPLLVCGCSLAFPLSEYDQGTGAQNQGGQGGDGAGGQAPACIGGFANPPMSSIVSSFDQGLGADLALLNCAVVENGEVTITDISGEYCWFYTTGSHRLTCDSITVRLLDEGYEEQGVQRFIYIRQQNGAGDLQLLQELHGFSFGPIALPVDAFSLPDDTWWRLSADADDVLSFETSSDGETWTLRGSGQSPFPLDDVRVEIGAGNYGAVADPGTARYDCFNVPAPCP